MNFVLLSPPSQHGGLSGRARADVALVTVQQAVPDPHVRPRGGVAQLSLTHPTLKAVNMEVQTQCLYDHGGPFSQRLPTAGAELLPTHRPVGGWRQ